MKGDYESCARHFRGAGTPPGKIKTLLADLLEKEEEVAVCKGRLRELEAAFYYNLELIEDRDLELDVLEKQLTLANTQLQEVTKERDELQDLTRSIEEKNFRKIQQLETRLTFKDEETRELQREDLRNATNLKRILEEAKQQQQMEIRKLNAKHELEKKTLTTSWRLEMEDKQKYFLLAADDLAAKLKKARREKEEAEEESTRTKRQLHNVEKLFQEKESYYLEEIRRLSKSPIARAHKAVQCGPRSEVGDKKIQAEPEIIATESQTIPDTSEEGGDCKKRMAFLQEQNEVLKCVVKELKKNRDAENKPHDQEGCQKCSAVHAEVLRVGQRVEMEISNFKKILEADQRQRAEEETSIQSLESSVACLKQKLLVGLQEKFKNFSGEDICSYACCREVRDEIQASLLEEKLGKKIDVLVKAAEQERQRLDEKMEEFKRECFQRMEMQLRPQREPSHAHSENLLEKIRTDIQKLEKKIESDMKNMARNDSENKCEKHFQARGEGNALRGPVFPEVPAKRYAPAVPTRGVGVHHDYYPDRCLSVVKCFQRRQGEHKEFGKLTNHLLSGR